MIKTGNKVVSIYTEMTPNPETMKFVTNKLLYPSKSIEFTNVEESEASPLAMELFTFPFVKSVFIASNFVTITKQLDVEWDDIITNIREFLKVYLEEGKVILDHSKLNTLTSNTTSSEEDSEIVKKIHEILDNYVKPAVEMDGGAIQFKDYNDGIVTVTLQGACSGCPSSIITLKSGIEGMMQRLIPEVKEVIAESE